MKPDPPFRASGRGCPRLHDTPGQPSVILGGQRIPVTFQLGVLTVREPPGGSRPCTVSLTSCHNIYEVVIDIAESVDASLNGVMADTTMATCWMIVIYPSSAPINHFEYYTST